MSACPKCGYEAPRRNLEQNALAAVWYPLIGDFMNVSPIEAKAYCKLQFAVPILRGESQEFRETYDRLVKSRFTYEEKLKLMEWLPASSLLTKGQFSRYMNDIQVHFAEQGLSLESINEVRV